MKTKEVVETPMFSRAANVRAASFVESDNTVEVVWTTGAPVRRMDWRNGRYYVELLEVTPKALRLDRLNSGHAPFLNTHSDYSCSDVIGNVVKGSVKIENGIGTARVYLSNAKGDADIVSKIKDGVISNVSVGYAIHGVEKTEHDDSDDEWRVIDWEPLEISAVPIPADAGSQIRSGDNRGPVPCEFVSEAATTSRVTAVRARMNARHRQFVAD